MIFFPRITLRKSFSVCGTILLLGVLPACFRQNAESEEKKKPENSAFLMFFQNTAVTDNLLTFAPQFQLARNSGVRRFVFHLSGGLPWSEYGTSANWEKIDSNFERYWKESADADVAPRILFEPPCTLAAWAKAAAVTDSEGKSVGEVSPSSPAFLAGAKTALHTLVRHIEGGKNAEHVWAYYLACLETGEWIPWNYRSQGADYSEVSRDGFREWLGKRYASDQEFAGAWGMPGALRSTAQIPSDTDARFPMKPLPPDRTIESFYKIPGEQNWVDYSEYVSELNLHWIQELAKVVRQESAKPAITFYGYVFELPGSMCGHLKARELLKGGDVQFVGAPISYWPYVQRLSGGAGAPMGAMDSAALHGITWINEDDTKTHTSMPGAKVPSWYWDESNPEHRALKNAGETDNIHRRNLAFTAFHGSATWWMDLIAAGWFSEKSTWDLWSGRFGADLREIHSGSLPFHPTLAVIVDEESRLYEKWVYSGFEEAYPALRNAAMACGAPVGFYYLDDFLEGRVPACPAYLFANAWRLSPKRLGALQSRLSKEKATVIWQYAPGYLNPAEGGTAGLSATCGFEIATDTGRLGSKGVGECAGLVFGGKNPIDPRIVIQDRASEPLARYQDGEVSAAVKILNGRRNILVADIGWTAALVHRMLGNLVCSDRPAVVHCSDQALYVYAVGDGDLHIKAPVGKTFEDGTVVAGIKLAKGESRLFALKSK